MSHATRSNRSAIAVAVALITLAAWVLAPVPAQAGPRVAGSAPPAGEALVSVRAHGARGDGTTDDTQAVTAAFAAVAARGAQGVHFPAGTYELSRRIDVPDAVRVIDLADGAVVRQHANDSTFEKVGGVRERQYAVRDARRGRNVLSVDSTQGLAVGDWFYFGSDDLIHIGKGFRRGFLRRITGVSGTQLTVDRPLHRSLQTNARGWEVVLAPPVEVRGGVLEQHDPSTKFHPILHFELVHAPRLTNVEIRSCGASGVRTIGTVGGVFDAFVHDCLDDESGARYGSGRHYGYGVEVAGASRDLLVRGRSTRTRHAFTTNSTYNPHSDKRLLKIGEPEDIVVSMDVWETTSSGLDTHEPGWNVVFRDCRVRDAGVYKRQGSTNGKEGGFGIFIRARGTRVERCVVERSADDGITVGAPPSGIPAWKPLGAPWILDTKILDGQGKRGIFLHQPAHLQRSAIVGPTLVGMQLHRRSLGSTGRQLTIDLRGRGSWGIVDPEHMQLQDVTIVGAARAYG